MMELRDTVELMVSDDYKERFRAEYWQLRIRCSKLRKLLCDWGAGRLDFEPTCSRELLERQYWSMNEYLVALKERALIEHIDLGIERCKEGGTMSVYGDDYDFSNVQNWNPVDGVWCPKCHTSFHVEEISDAYGDGYIEEWDHCYTEAIPSFCPFCGKKLPDYSKGETDE